MQQPDRLSQADSARINGSKSKGPVTPDGRARSCMNNLQHGMYSSRVILDNENPAAYHALAVEYKELFLPQDVFEAECVDTMINGRWLFRRMENAQTAALNIALAETAKANSEKYEKLDPRHEHSIAYDHRGDNTDRLDKLHDRCDRRYCRAYRLLENYRRKLKRQMPAAGPAPQQNTPDERVEPAEESAPPPAASIITKIAAIIVLFALLSLTPLRTAVAPIIQLSKL